MAAILCGIHGRQYCVFASRYLVDRIDARLPPERKICVLKLNLMEEPGWFLVDEDFVSSMGEICPPGGQIDVENEDQAFELFTRLAPVCVKCFDEYLPRFGLVRPGPPGK